MKMESRTILNKRRGDYDICIPSFIELGVYDICRVPFISVYKRPKDYPGYFVARLYNIMPGEVLITRYIMLENTLDNIHKGIPETMTMILPYPSDDPEMIETWV